MEDINKYPLRKVIGYVDVDGNGWIKEKLECGHIVGIKQDIYGATNAYRRRCKQCPIVRRDRE